MVIWSLITGIVSIISFLIALNDRCKNWKQYLWYCGFCFIGISIGILLTSIEKVSISFNSDQILVVLLFLGLIVVVGFITSILIKKGQDILGYFVFLIFLVSVTPKFTEIYQQKTENIIEIQDLLVLAKHYEQKKLYDKSIRILELYKKKIPSSDSILRITIDKQIQNLKSEQLIIIQE